MNKSGWWIAVVAAAWLVLACDPKKAPNPTDPPKPIALISQPAKTAHLDDLPR